MRTTLFDTMSWTCGAYFFVLLGLDSGKTEKLEMFSKLWFESYIFAFAHGLLGTFACFTVSLLLSYWHQVMEQSIGLKRSTNILSFALILLELSSIAALQMGVQFVARALNSQIKEADSLAAVLAWTFCSFVVVSSLLWSTLLTKETQIRELEKDADLFEKRPAKLLRGWNGIRLWMETWACSFVLADALKKVELKYLGPKRDSGKAMFCFVVAVEIVLGWVLLAIVHRTSDGQKKLLLKQTNPDYDEDRDNGELVSSPVEGTRLY